MDGNVEVIENIYDSIVWIRIKPGVICDQAVFFACCYIPPENSQFYNENDIDLYQRLENSICKYKSEGTIFIFGDFNSRIGMRDDVILNDDISDTVLDTLSAVIDYRADENLSKRNSLDKQVNQFGRKLIDLCKTTGIRVVNGRHQGDPCGNFSFYNARGTSLIDYLLTEGSQLSNVADFVTGQFNTFSDHSPVSFTLKFTVSRICDFKTSNSGIVSYRNRVKSVKWNDNTTELVNSSLSENLDSLLN